MSDDRHPLSYPVICQLCGELLPEINPLRHLARHRSGELATLSVSETFARGTEAIALFHARKLLLSLMSRRRLELQKRCPPGDHVVDTRNPYRCILCGAPVTFGGLP